MFNVRGKHCIQIPKLYTTTVTWDPHHYRLVQDSQPLDLNKGTFFTTWGCLPFLPGSGSLSSEPVVEETTGTLCTEAAGLGLPGICLSRCLQEPVGVPESRPCFVSEGGRFRRKPWEGDGETDLAPTEGLLCTTHCPGLFAHPL